MANATVFIADWSVQSVWSWWTRKFAVYCCTFLYCLTLQVLLSMSTNDLWAFFYWVLHGIMLPRISPSFKTKFLLWSWNGRKFLETIFLTQAVSTYLQLSKTQRKICFSVTGLFTWKGRCAIGSLLAHPGECTKTTGQVCHVSLLLPFCKAALWWWWWEIWCIT